MKTIFYDAIDDKEYDDDWTDVPLLHRGVLVRGPWGSRRVVDVAVNMSQKSQTTQHVTIGQINA